MDDEILNSEVASVFSIGSQNARLLRMDFPRHDGPADVVMLANKVMMREELSRDFFIQVEILSDSAHISLKSVMGKMVTISLVREDGSLRYMNGYVGKFCFAGTDGGFAFYQMTLQPWLAFTKLRTDSRSFHHRSVLELTEATFALYRQADWRTRMSVDYLDKKLTYLNQHNETDHNHLHRRWEDAGLYYFYEHRNDGHTLVLSDNSQLAEVIDNAHVGGEVSTMFFQAQSGSQEGDGICSWEAVRELRPGRVSLATFNYKSPRALRVETSSLYEQGDVEQYEEYEDAGAYAYANLDDGDLLAQRRIEEIDRKLHYFEAAGNDRTAQSGRRFKLSGHFSCEVSSPSEQNDNSAAHSSSEFLIVSVEHVASNNYPAGPDAKSEYQNKFTCARDDMRWRPGRRYNSKPCVVSGVQTAIVVGPPGEDIYTDELGRIKLQFHWDRVGEFDQASSPWIRVMMPMAGAYLGQICLPRIGQEVVVQFLDGNIDHPIVVGVVYNNVNRPPWNLPSQRALSGLRSRELKSKGAGGSNHVILDDTKEAIQVQIRSDYQHSQLSLGSITRIESAEGRQDARGEGWELATNAWGVARAGRGMLITTEARFDGSSYATSMNETIQRLVAAAELHEELAHAAQKSGAQDTSARQAAVSDGLVRQNQTIEGSDSGTGKTREFKQPHLVLASPAGIETTTANSTHIASDEHTALTTGRSLSIAAGQSVFASVGESFRLFVRKAGMKLVAASGKVAIRAQSDDIEAIAQKVVSIISESDWVDIRGRKGIRLHGANSMVEISEKVQFFTPSPTLFHGNLETLSPSSRPQPTEQQNDTDLSTELHSRILAHSDGLPLANVPYEVKNGDAIVKEGLTDAVGRVVIPHEAGTPEYQITLGNGETFALKVSPRFAEEGKQSDEQRLSNQGFRAMDDTTDGRKYD